MAATETVPSFQTLQSLIRLFEQDLDNVQHKFQHAWTDETEINLQSAKLHLYALCFISQDFQSPDNITTGNAASFKLIVISGLAAAVRLIYVFSEICASPAEVALDDAIAKRAFAVYCPKIYHKNLCKHSRGLLNVAVKTDWK